MGESEQKGPALKDPSLPSIMENNLTAPGNVNSPAVTRNHDELEKIDDGLNMAVRNALTLARNHAFNIVQPDGHWVGEQRGNATITAEYVFLRQSLNLSLTHDGPALRKYILSDQKADGSWSIAPSYPGDVSTSVEAYLALKILSVPATDTAAMSRARDFIIAAGGVEKVRIFTRFYLAAFGLFPWTAVPELPVELALMPKWAPINIYHLSSWARSTIMPLLILSHHQPVYALPNGKSAKNDFLDELWCNPTQKNVPYSERLGPLLATDWTASSFVAVDKALHFLNGLRSFPLRSYARRQCIEWILEHQEGTGDWGGIFPPMHLDCLALVLEGFSVMDDQVVRGLEAIERFAWQDSRGKRMQPCVGPVWDTILMTIGLCDAGIQTDDPHLVRAVDWFKSRQLFGVEGDWRVYNSRLKSGGFSFEYFNTWYPDVDDTAAAVLAFIKQDSRSANSDSVTAALEWTLGMQNRDGGWAAFDLNNDKIFLNKIPFSDMDSPCDPSSADVTGRVLEAFGLLDRISLDVKIKEDLMRRMRFACESAIIYLASTQEPTGAWYGRWGCNYIYGTSNVLCGLAYFARDNPRVQNLVKPAVSWLLSVQNTDGGWGEDLDTYIYPKRAGCGSSTASQTAWGAMALLAHLSKHDKAIERSVAYLVRSQTDREGNGSTWPEVGHLGTDFPGHFYLGYTLYPHFFPMMALGRYLEE